MINVYSANETNFNHNGLATLNPLSADLSVEVNGTWVLTLVLPWDREKKYTYVEKNNIIIADINCIREQASKRQKFRIYDYKKNYNTITVKACPVAFEATFDVPITNLSLVGDNGNISGVEAAEKIQEYVDDVVVDKYTITTDVTKTAKADYTNSNLIKAIASSDDNSFINTWGGEVAYDNYDIKIKTALGDQDNASAYPIVYGKNITGVEYGIDVSNVVTRIYPISSDDMRLNEWNDLDATGKSTQQYVDGNTSAYPYIRSGFLVVDRAELIDTNSKSISDTRTRTLAWQEGIINKVRTVAKTLWQEVKKNEDQRFSPEYVQDLIPDIVNYVQARYTFSHKGWQSFIKSCIKQGIEWIKDEELAEWGWKGDYGAWWYGENSEIYAHDQYVLINKVYEYFNDEGYWQDWCRFTDADWHQTSDGTWWYGNKNDDGSTKNYAVSQYIYIYAEGKWYEFDGEGFYIDEEIPAETIALLNSYTWREDSTGWYYGDGNGNYLTNSWVESSEGKHYWVGADGYMDETKTDEQSWMWFTEPSKYRYGDYERYFAHNEYVYMTVEGQMKEWWYDKEGWYDDSKSGDSDFGWHGDGSASNPYWFGEEDAGTEDKNKYIHDKWAFIDGTYYWFDEYGYISGDASKAKQNYQWGVQTDTVTGDTWFGNPDRTYEAIYVKSQWLKIDNEWYYFGSDGYKVNMDEKKAEIIAWFGDEIYDETHEYIDDCLEEAYTYLYADMTAWANEQFTNGIDAPAVTVNVSLVDLSKTTEYKNYASFEQICLGDKVEVKALGMSFTERVVGLTYDVIRGYNTNVTIGKLGDTISSLMSTSFASVESGGTARLIGGDGVKLDGNVISSENVAVTYGIQDATLEGVSIVHGNVARLNDIYRELTQSQYNALSSQEKNSGKLFYITDTQTIMHKGVAYGGGSISYGTSTPTGGSDGDVYFQTDSNNNIVKIWQNHSGVWGGMTGGSGLQYFVETEDALYGINGDAQYMREDARYRHTAPAVFTSYRQPNSTSGYTVHTCPNIDYNDIVGIRGSQFAPLFGRVGGDGIFIISKDPTHCYFTVEEWNGTYPQTGAPNYSDSYSYSSTHNVKTELNVYHKSNSGAISDTFTFNGETYYIVIDGQSWDWWTERTEIETEYKWFTGEWRYPSVEGYYETIGAYGLAIMQANIASQKYNGISRDDGLAFFAGASDGQGTNAPIKIFDNGTAEGLATTADLALKQDKLIAGNNISIGSDGKTINAKVYANPEDTATETMSKIMVGDTTYEIQGGGGGGSNLILDAQKYSLDEQVVGIWTDGKPIYQKTIVTTDIPKNTIKYISHGLPIDKTIDVKGMLHVKLSIEPANSYTLLPRIQDTSSAQLIAVDVNSQQILLKGRQYDFTEVFDVAYITLQYTKTTDTAGSGGYQAYGFTPIIYSDTEREIGVWRDNKPLYQKTFYLASCSGVEDPLVADLSNLGIETIVSGSGMCLNVSNYVIPINYAHQNSTYDVTWLVNDLKTRLELRLGSGQRTLHDIYITLQYTKTTDVAGSGEYNTLAIPNVHYSTDEQVIGTWIDGKTLYQKTWELSSVLSVASNTWVDTSILKQGIDAIMYVNGANAEGAVFSFLGARAQTSTTSYVQIQQTRNSAITLKYITIQYTKTT